MNSAKAYFTRGKCVAFMGILSLGMVLPDVVQAAFDPAKTFEKKCSSCHTIGGGDSKGPDLKGVTKRRKQSWIIKFIQSSESMIQAGDPQAVELFKKFDENEMPDQKLTDEEVVALLGFIDGGGAGQLSVQTRSATTATPLDIEWGRKLFVGTKALKNGGPPCVSCHSTGTHGPLGGGTLAADLTHVYSQYKDNGLTTALKNTAFPIMTEVYGNRKIDDDEAFALKAFFYHEDVHSAPPKGFQKKFAFLGLAGLVLAMGVIDFSWRRRRKRSVRRFQGGLR